MHDAAARRERQDAVLAELSELGLTLARELHARALAAETTQEAEKLALAFQRVSRGVRQTFALELKFERARREADHALERSERDRRIERHRAHRDRVRSGVERLIWTETEDEDEADDLREELELRLGEAAVAEGFEDTPVETLVDRIRIEMGLGRGGVAPGSASGGDGPAFDSALADTG